MARRTAADMIASLPLPENADVVVLGDTAYACEKRGYIWIFPANPERVYEGLKGERPKLRSAYQRNHVERYGSDRVVLPALADRVVLQGA